MKRFLLGLLVFLWAAVVFADDPFVAIVGWDVNNRVTKYANFDSLPKAQTHASFYGGFAAARPDGAPDQWLVDPGGKKVSLSEPKLTGAEFAAVVNREADKRLLAAYPLTEQAWGALEAGRLLKKKTIDGKNLTADDVTTFDATIASRDWISSLRTAKAAILADGSGTQTAILADVRWPASP